MLPASNEDSNLTFCITGDAVRDTATHVDACEWVSGEKAGWITSSAGAHLELSAEVRDAGETQLSLGFLHGH